MLLLLFRIINLFECKIKLFSYIKFKIKLFSYIKFKIKLFFYTKFKINTFFSFTVIICFLLSLMERYNRAQPAAV